MGPLLLAAIGAGLGALKSAEEKNIWADQQRAEADKSKYGAWTGQWGKNLAGPTGDMGNVMAGAMAGYGVGQKGDMTNSSSDSADTNLAEEEPMNTSIMDDTRPMSNYYRMHKRQGLGIDYGDEKPTLYGH